MPTARYKFSRDHRNIEKGFMSRNNPSTDALSTLLTWKSAKGDREYRILEDNDEALRVEISWSDSDPSAGPDLNSACKNFGLSRTYEGC